MKIIIQRVLNAKLYLEDDIFIEIGKGLLVYVGFGNTDTKEEVKSMSKKICDLKIFENEKGRLGNSLIESNTELLIVSNFTLYANSKKNIMSFLQAAKPETANNLYNYFITCFQDEGVTKLKSGKFGNYMKILSINDGPVNIIIESGI